MFASEKKTKHCLSTWDLRVAVLGNDLLITKCGQKT